MQEEDRTLHVGNLDDRITEEFIGALFGQVGEVAGIRIIAGATSKPYAIVKFADQASAAEALEIMDKRQVLDYVIDVKWIQTTPVLEKKANTNQNFNIFVGDLSPDVDSKVLKEAFEQVGEVLAAKVIYDPQSLNSKGYGFVSFSQRAEAERAMEQMNGKLIGKRTVRTNWASRKTDFGDSQEESNRPEADGPLTFEQILSQTGPENTTVFVGNVHQNAEDENLLNEFSRFGEIAEVRRFKSYGNTFLKFNSKEKAARAIHEMNGAEFMGQMLRCSWGKAEGSKNGSQAQGGPNSQGGSQYRADSQYMWPQYNYGYQQQY